MRRVLNTVIATALLLGLGALAVLALPNANNSLAGAPAVPAAVPEFNPDAPAATLNYNAIALPLDASAQFAYNSQGLATYIGTSVQQVLRLDAARQGFDVWYPTSQDGFVGGNYTTTPFSLATGMGYWILLDNTAPAVFSTVGNVPAQGSIHFTLVGTSPSCSYNQITLPLDQSSITDANQLATSIGGADKVDQVVQLNAGLQSFDTWYPASQDGFVGGSYTTTPFPVKIGYPYWVCTTSGANGQVWP